MGSTKAGEELTSSELNLSNGPTMIVAGQRTSDKTQWGGSVIFLATPVKNYGVRPWVKLDGIVGIANNGGAGVRGVGNQPEGPRGATAGSGTGGDGVVGHGGTGDLEPDSAQAHRASPPGMGVLGIGGNWAGPERFSTTSRDNRGGAGVVGVGGADQAGGPWVPPFDQTRGVGVYGISNVAEGMVAIGAEYSAGVRAVGNMGVAASGRRIGVSADGGIGVYAVGRSGPAGWFQREANRETGACPQIYVAPTPMVVPDPVDIGTVSALPADQVDQLPQNAHAGELLMTIQPSKGGAAAVENGAEATLWLCVAGSYLMPDKTFVHAVWKQVLLGPPIKGTQNNPAWIGPS